MRIKFLLTGGTIDNLEYTNEAETPKSYESIIPYLLNQSRSTIDYSVENLMQKDSRFINNNDRELILNRCINCHENKIIITHGTITMTDTANYIGKENLDKTIVIFGAMIPANKDNSDALFNLGAAVLAVQTLQHGVYIIMNGRIFNYNNVRKNIALGIFEEEHEIIKTRDEV